MNKSDLLKTIAEKAYDIGYGAKRNFATYDMITKFPDHVSFISIVIGICGLAWPCFTKTTISVTVLIIGIASLLVSKFTCDSSRYSKEGTKETELFNQLKKMYMNVKGLPENEDVSAYVSQLNDIENEFYGTSIVNQIWFSSWYAHYKFFNEMNIDWLDEQLHFKLWKDKIPGTLKVVIVLSVIALAICALYKLFNVVC